VQVLNIFSNLNNLFFKVFEGIGMKWRVGTWKNWFEIFFISESP